MSQTSSATPDAPLSHSAKAADAASAALIAIAAWWLLVARPVGVFNAISEALSPAILLYVAGSIQVVRHLLWPRPSVAARLNDVREQIRARPHLYAACRAFVMTRPAVFVIAVAAVATIGITSTPGFVLSRDPLANLPARFDAGWYGGIALDGYYWDNTFQRQRNIAFFPAMPMLMRPVGAVLGMYENTVPRERRMLRVLWAGTVVSLVAFFWALVYVSRLAEDLIGAERAPAATFLLAAYPFAVYFSAPYTEALFLLGAAGASYHFLRRDWIAASMWGLLCGLSRPNGCFLSVALGMLALFPGASVSGPSASARLRRGSGGSAVARNASEGWRAPRAVRTADGGATSFPDVLGRLVVAAMPGIGMLLFTVYLHQLTGGVWFAWARSHEAWGRTYGGLEPVLHLAQRLRDEPFLPLLMNDPFNALNAIAVLFALALTYPVCRRVGLAWGVFVLISLVPPLFAGGLVSMGRLTSTLFPLFLALAALLPPRAVPVWATAFGIGQGLAATLFFTWHALF
jgi:hypothetical protein